MMCLCGEPLVRKTFPEFFLTFQAGVTTQITYDTALLLQFSNICYIFFQKVEG